MKNLTYALWISLAAALPAVGQDFEAAAFVGTWEGEYTSTTFGGSQFPMTLEVEAGGFFTDSSGHLMPPYYYPNTQLWEFDADTNRLHFWHLKTVYAGMSFYQHYYYEIVSYTGDSLEMHYNFWDDPEPHPQAGSIVLYRSGSTAVQEDEDTARPLLAEAYPNPFNPSTTLSFTLPTPAAASLKVLDLRGREVATLVSGPMDAGTHTYTWHADGVAGGTYLYRLQVGDHIEIQKMTLIK